MPTTFAEPSAPTIVPTEPTVGPRPRVGRAPHPRLRGFAPALDTPAELPVRLTVAAVGFLPVTLIAASTFGVWELRDLALWVLLPAVIVLAVLTTRSPLARRLVAQGLARGAVATLVYDLFRWSFLWLGWMAVDPIPHIGSALGLSPAWMFGYAWRYLGNGGGLAIAFGALGLKGTRAGMVYGLFVCGGLLVTLAVAPYAQEVLFPLNATTVVMATIGHLLYGAVLGAMAARRA